ncbi:MAG: diguanylate cyclase [Lachnospiraceae bacterium]|nr:diguanylate cyclase [Lachnospiraceae bacterium]
MNNSIKGKMITVISFGIILTTVVILIVSCISISILTRNDSNELMEHITAENINKMDQDFLQISHAVNSLSVIASDHLAGNAGKLNNEDFRQEYMERIQSILLREAKAIPAARMAYFRLDANYEGTNVGFIYSRDPVSGAFAKATLTDIKKYDENDLEHVGWYYLPKKGGSAMWIGPYENKNFDVRIISYVSPVYCGDKFIGVMGMDIAVSDICEHLDSVVMYETGTVTLYDVDNNIVYSRMYPSGKDAETFNDFDLVQLDAKKKSLITGEPVTYDGVNGNMKIYAKSMSNGLTMSIQVPKSEINSAMYNVVRFAVIISVIILIVGVLVTARVVESFLEPMGELIKAADQLAVGNFDVDMGDYDNDEIGKLATTYTDMADLLKKYYSYFHSLGYVDKMTGLNNKASFAMMSNMIDGEIKLNKAAFSLVIMDINNLKNINDSLGPEKGDYLIRRAAEVLRRTFVGYPLYRVGGDEFCCIIINNDPGLLVDQLDRNIAKNSKEDEEIFRSIYTIATGSAIYDKDKDRCFDDVFNRAARDMHDNKRKAREKVVVKFN